MIAGYVAVWLCWCTTAALTAEEIPAECEHHGKTLTGPPVPIRRPGGMRLGHDCSLRDNADDSPAERPGLTVVRGVSHE